MIEGDGHLFCFGQRKGVFVSSDRGRVRWLSSSTIIFMIHMNILISLSNLKKQHDSHEYYQRGGCFLLSCFELF